jgi:hypothetical protein
MAFQEIWASHPAGPVAAMTPSEMMAASQNMMMSRLRETQRTFVGEDWSVANIFVRKIVVLAF